MEDEYNLGTGMTMIVVIIEDGVEPRIDLDGCHPLVAANIFRSAAEMLESLPQRPTITTLGQLVAADEDFLYIEFDEDE